MTEIRTEHAGGCNDRCEGDVHWLEGWASPRRRFDPSTGGWIRADANPTERGGVSECTCGHYIEGHDADGCFPECGCGDPGPGPATSDARLSEVREFAAGLLAYEDEHANGPETPTIRAIARDLLSIVEGDDA